MPVTTAGTNVALPAFKLDVTTRASYYDNWLQDIKMIKVKKNKVNKTLKANIILWILSVFISENAPLSFKRYF